MFGDRLKALRTDRGYSLEMLAKLYNERFDGRLNKSTISRYENNLQEPMITVARNMATLFGVSMDDLNGDDRTIPSPNITDDVVTFRVNADIAAGYDQPAMPLSDWEGAEIDVPKKYLHGRPQDDYFMIRICGDSMYPHYQDGDYVLVLKQPTLNRSGEVGILLFGDEGTIKKIEYVDGEDWLKLIPFNPEYKEKVISGSDLEQCRVIGIPKLLIRDL